MTTEYEAALQAAGVPQHQFSFDPRPQYQQFTRDPSSKGIKVFRDEFVKRYAWAIPSIEALKMIAKYSPIIEVGSGNGYWAYELRKKFGVSIIPTDLYEPKHNEDYTFYDAWVRIVAPLPADAAARAFDDRALMFVWPSYSQSWPSEALRYYRGDTVIYVGEGQGGCTGDDAFHEQLATEWEQIEGMRVPQWGGVHDWLEIFRRKP